MTRHHYSQNGEDFLAWSLLGDRQGPGYFVEVGALDGRRFSNTLSFEEAGWSGICVEAHPDYFPLVRASRPGSTCIHAACCDKDGQSITFHANARGSLSAIEPFDQKWLSEKFGQFMQGFQQVQVPARTLTSMLRQCNAPHAIDLLSIDVEGNEMMVLAGLDLAEFHPRLVIIEAHASNRLAITSHMAAHRYQIARQVASNLLFVRSDADATALRRTRLRVELVHTAHPRDPHETDRHLRYIDPADVSFLARALRSARRRLRRLAIGSARTVHPGQSPQPSSKVAGSVDDDRGRLHQLGFHGDAHLLAIIDRLLPHVDGFIETGANLGSTTRYVADRFAILPVLSCEPDAQAAASAAEHVKHLSNAKVFNEFSPAFLHQVFSHAPQLASALNCYFLDAHGHGFTWPLADEIALITAQRRGIIIVDDCQVPGRDEFKFSKYAGQVCGMDYIRAALNPQHDYDVVFPDYNERTSPHHALAGYVLIAFGTPLLRQAIEGNSKFRLMSLTASSLASEAA